MDFSVSDGLTVILSLPCVVDLTVSDSEIKVESDRIKGKWQGFKKGIPYVLIQLSHTTIGLDWFPDANVIHNS